MSPCTQSAGRKSRPRRQSRTRLTCGAFSFEAKLQGKFNVRNIQRHRPPEDVGGIGGYETFLEAISDKDHEEYNDMLVWAEKDTGGRKFDPEYFYINEVNRALKKIKS